MKKMQLSGTESNLKINEINAFVLLNRMYTKMNKLLIKKLKILDKYKNNLVRIN